MKNLENEYRKMIQQETPDLWNRIEAGLTEKKEITETAKTTETAKITETTDIPDTEEKKAVIKRSVWKRAVRYSGIAAACLCGVIIIPAIALSLLTGAFGSTKMAATGAAEETAKAAPAEEAVEEAAEATETAEGMEITDGLNISDGMEITEETETVGTIENAGIHAGSKGSIDTAGENRETEDAVCGTVVLADGSAIENIKVRILETDELKYHITYKASVEEDASGVFDSGYEIEFIAEKSLQEILEEEKAYQVTLIYESDSDIPFRLIKAEE